MANERRRQRPVNGWRVAGWSMAGLLLLIPWIAMRFTDEVHWTASDFVFAAVMIGSVGGAFELAVRTSDRLAYRAGAALMLITLFLIVWINAAVGIIGDEGNPLNLLYAAVVATAVGGALVARFKAAGMVRAAAAAAGVLALVGIVAVAAGSAEPPGALGLAVLNGGLAAMLAGAAALFALAARPAG